MNNISITIEMYVESWVRVVKLDVQYDHQLILPLFLVATAIGQLNYQSFTFSLSHAYDIPAERPSMSPYRFKFLQSIFFMVSQIA